MEQEASAVRHYMRAADIMLHTSSFLANSFIIQAVFAVCFLLKYLARDISGIYLYFFRERVKQKNCIVLYGHV